jgi:hypothetical protein
MKRIILISLFMLMTRYSIGQLVANKADKAKSIEVYTKWMRKNNLSFKQLPKVKSPSKLVYDCDTNLLVKRISGDTITYWLKSSWYHMGSGYSKGKIDELNKTIKRSSFGLTEYFERFDENGSIVLVTLAPIKLKIKNDTLFKLESFFKIPFDSIGALLLEAASNEKTEEVNKKIINDNIYYVFKPIFHPGMFMERRIIEESAGHNILLEHEWSVNGKKYYQISFTSESDGRITKFPTYIFDENYKFLQYEGCNKELEFLTMEHEIFPKN